ncbi:MAG TPA: DUF503 domain-containing protein [Dehalococcoidia bacterium]|nr:DUF503 domain-containing protein [Dehalococcoidia bacterium]
MLVGVLRVRLRVPESQSLKAKRQVVKSLVARLQNRFHLSAAEVGDLDSWQLATIGVACVSNDERHASEVLSSVMEFVRRERLDAEILDYETEIIDAGA